MRLRVLLVLLLSLLVIAAFNFGLQDILTFMFLKNHYQKILALYAQSPWTTGLCYFALYTLLTAVSFPGASLLSILAGTLFGWQVGSLIVALAATLGATLAFILARYVLRAEFEKRYKDQAIRINARVEREGAFYLFAIRLNPMIPFVMINLLMGLTSMRIWTYSWISLLGMLPATFIYVNAGTQLAKISEPSQIMSPTVLISLSLLGLFPLLLKKLVPR